MNAKPSLTPCPACARPVSARARACPSCGHPLAAPRARRAAARASARLRRAASALYAHPRTADALCAAAALSLCATAFTAAGVIHSLGRDPGAWRDLAAAASALGLSVLAAAKRP